MKTYAIIGDSRGIGEELRNQLLEAGHRVIGVSRSGGSHISPNYESVEHDAVEEAIDLSQYTDVLDGLAYCPGTINLKPFQSIKEEQVMDDLKVNYLGAFKNLQSNMRLLRKSAPASVVLFSTVAVGTGLPFHSSISGAKAAVEGLTRSLAAEWAPHIRVNAIAPSLTATPLADPLLNNEKKKEAAEQRHPLKRVGTAQELAGAALFLLTDASSWVTGQVMGVDGGMAKLRV